MQQGIRYLSFVWSTGVLIFLVFGCSQPKQAVCTLDRDCPTGHLCNKDDKGEAFCEAVKLDECPSSCKVDADCSKCDAEKQQCVQGVCGKETEKTCPTTSTSNQDCIPCLSNQSYCVGGVCGEKPTCPQTCAQDADCAPCTDTKFCVEGACAKEKVACPSTCTKDDDCKSCPDQKLACTEGTCQQPSQCPDSCATDTDCSKCAVKDRVCVFGKCGDPDCPASCQDDSDCAKCSSGNTSCVNNVCSAKAVCPKFCFIDQDCAQCSKDLQKCTNGSCGDQVLCPESCNADSDCSACPANRVACRNGSCAEKDPCPTTCTEDKDCSACGTGYVCDPTAKTCKNPNAVGVGGECDANKPCQRDLSCLAIENIQKSYCFQVCNPKSKICDSNKADGRDQCLEFPIEKGSEHVCIGSAAKGEACGFAIAKQALCDVSTSATLYCSTKKGTCEDITIQTKEDDPCTPTGSTDEPILRCDVSKGLYCDPTTKKCGKQNFAQEGELCDPSGRVLGKVINCGSGMSCVSFATGTNLRCHVDCSTNQSGQCSHNKDTTCVPTTTGGAGACLDTQCQSDADCTFKGYFCLRSQSGNICAPEPPAGPVSYGGICGIPLDKYGCDAKSSCAQVSAGSLGFCTVGCDSKTPCPSLKTANGDIKATCVSQRGVLFCVFLCDSNSPVCPTGMKCQKTPAGSYCFP
ncbi:MAG TPA: hypothetical protein DCE42_00360 [Myxococcales bacterium]|nr:hypothetical protein [Myxococcales bacterium]